MELPYIVKSLDGDEALKIEYLLPDEERFIINAAESFEEYAEFVSWIKVREDSTCPWEHGGIISYGFDVDEKENPCYWIHRLIIHPTFRHRGIASRVLENILGKIPKGFEIYTSIIEGNTYSESLFKKVGFVKTVRAWEDELIWQYRSATY